MVERTVSKISLPADTGPHWFSNIEWWYFYTFLTGDKGGRFAVMASFFRVGETEFKKGHYLIYSLIDLNKNKQRNYSIIGENLKLNMVGIYLPFYLLLHPTHTEMWRLYKSLLTGQIPSPHKQINDVTIKKDPTNIMYGENSISFYGEKEDCFWAHFQEKNGEIDLQFTPKKPISLIGEDGKPDHLYYYSFTQNDVQGKIYTDNGVEKVKGQGWFDHQWGRDYTLLKGHGWNWFGLQLEDGRELLLNEMYSSKSKKTNSPMANLIEKDGSIRFTRNVIFEEKKYWKSLKTNGKYPVEWKITIPDFSIELDVAAYFPNQEMTIIGPMRAIWEGACTVSGHETTPSGRKRALTGMGFMELVGYASL